MFLYNKKNTTKILIFFIFSFSTITYKSQAKVNCDDLTKYIIEHYAEKDDLRMIVNSTLLIKASWYEYDGNGFVIAYIKKNEIDFNGVPYIFCGISKNRWEAFKKEGFSNLSYGKAFHKYIMDYTCNCE